ncbi:MAG: hypothetical protein ACOX3A_05645 [bacterium]
MQTNSTNQQIKEKAVARNEIPINHEAIKIEWYNLISGQPVNT